MTFSYTVDDLTTDDGTESFTFNLKDAGEIPVGILRRNRRNQDGLMWDTFEWAMPSEEIDAFDRLTVTQVVEMFQAWQDSQNAPAQVDQDKPVGPPKAKKTTAKADAEADSDQE